eukprot:5683568-Prymnesium_polylepis.1
MYFKPSGEGLADAIKATSTQEEWASLKIQRLKARFTQEELASFKIKRLAVDSHEEHAVDLRYGDFVRIEPGPLFFEAIDPMRLVIADRLLAPKHPLSTFPGIHPYFARRVCFPTDGEEDLLCSPTFWTFEGLSLWCNIDVTDEGYAGIVTQLLKKPGGFELVNALICHVHEQTIKIYGKEVQPSLLWLERRRAASKYRYDVVMVLSGCLKALLHVDYELDASTQ